MKHLLLILTVLLAFAAPAMAHEEGVAVQMGDDQQVVEIVIPVDATEAELAMLAEKLNAIEPSAQQ